MANTTGRDGDGTVGFPLALRARWNTSSDGVVSTEVRTVHFDSRRIGVDPDMRLVSSSVRFMLARPRNAGRPSQFDPYLSVGPEFATVRGAGSGESVRLWGAAAGYGIYFPVGGSAIRVEAAARYDVSRGREGAVDYFPSRFRAGLLVGLSGFIMR
jgi:hypothetical protein